jgi:hypothetical protein
MTGLRKLLLVGTACVCAVLSVALPASAKSPTGSVLRLSDLPARWVVNRSALVGFIPPCLASAEASLARYPNAKVAGAGNSGDLVEFAEQVVTIPPRILRARYSAILQGYAACNDSTWTRGKMKFNLLIERRAVPGAWRLPYHWVLDQY